MRTVFAVGSRSSSLQNTSPRTWRNWKRESDRENNGANRGYPKIDREINEKEESIQKLELRPNYSVLKGLLPMLYCRFGNFEGMQVTQVLTRPSSFSIYISYIRILGCSWLSWWRCYTNFTFWSTVCLRSLRFLIWSLACMIIHLSWIYVYAFLWDFTDHFGFSVGMKTLPVSRWAG